MGSLTIQTSLFIKITKDILLFIRDVNDIGGNCKSIVYLNVEHTAVTTVGARLAIKNLPKLKIFQCRCCSVQAIAELFDTAAASGSHSSLQQSDDGGDQHLPLMNLFCTSSNKLPYVRGALAAAVQFCPFIVDVHLFRVKQFFDKDLRVLLNLKQLHSLTLQDRMDISFDGGILPILRKFGSKSLEKFDVRGPEVDVSAIAQHCPKLRSLTLIEICRYIQSPPQSSKPRQYQLNLECLLVVNFDWPNSTRSPSSADLSILLISSPSLMSITMCGIVTLTDQLIERVAIFHGFPKLNNVDVEYCDTLTTNAIDILLSLKSPITGIVIGRCEELDEEDVDEWNEMAQKNNWDLSITLADIEDE